MKVQKSNIFIGSLAAVFFLLALVVSLYKGSHFLFENKINLAQSKVARAHNELLKLIDSDEVWKELQYRQPDVNLQFIETLNKEYDLGENFDLRIWQDGRQVYWQNNLQYPLFEVQPEESKVDIVFRQQSPYLKVQILGSQNRALEYTCAIDNLPLSALKSTENQVPILEHHFEEELNQWMDWKSTQSRDSFKAWLFLFGYIFTILFVFNTARAMLPAFGPQIVYPILTFVLIALRLPSIFYPLISSSETLLFQPHFLDIGSPISMADILINIFTFLIFAIFYFRDFKDQKIAGFSLPKKYLYTLLGYLIFTLFCLFYLFYIKAIIGNRFIALNIKVIPNLSATHFLVLLATFLLLIGIFIVTIKIFLSIRTFNLDWAKKLGLFTIAVLTSLIFFFFTHIEVNIWLWILSLFIIMLLFDLFLDSTMRDFTWISVWLLILCLFTTVLFYHFYKVKVHKMAIDVLSQKIAYPDTALLNLLDVDPNNTTIDSSNQIKTQLNNLVFEHPDILDKYQISLTHTLPQKIEISQPNLYKTLEYYSPVALPKTYYINYPPMDTSLVTFLQFKERNSGLYFQNPGNFEKQKIFEAGDWTIYHGLNNLNKDDLFFPEKLQSQKDESDHLGFVNSELIQYTIAKKNELTIIGRQEFDGLLQPLSFFSFLFILALLILLFIIGLHSIYSFLPEEFNNYFLESLTIRNKIQFSVLSLLVVAFTIVGIVSANFYKRTFKESLKDSVNDYYQSIHKTPHQAGDLANLLAELPSPYILYDEDGKYIASSAISQKLPQRIDYQRLIELRTTTKPIDSYSWNYDQLYFPLFTADEKKVYLSYYQFEPVPAGFYNFLNLLLNAFVFLLLISSALSFSISNSIISPLTELGMKLKEFALGQQNEPLKWNQSDELGALIQAYNEMVEKLEQSAELLARTEREVAWREMAKQVAHEIKNPLTPMKLSIQHMDMRIQRTEEEEAKAIVKDVSKVLIEQIDNLSRIASEFSSFAKLPKPEYEEILLNDLVTSVHDLFRTRSDIKFNLYVPIDEIVVLADRSHLVRVLNNLVKNAVQSIPDDTSGYIFIRLKEEDNRAIVQIEDNGKGIPDELKEKVFFPNFTTKTSGTGLGLAICKNIIGTFNGNIYFSSKKPHGTIFTFELPILNKNEN
ncbi:sensor histidine kinase [Membranihabitans marinus]|uniref:sensor histidine kinase n=1 Tax=Membranihabitans marinus TaxID=1227546 RepID=UPI001F43A8F3|nr:ATP-binding protein [Membranihabitans marinus]